MRLQAAILSFVVIILCLHGKVYGQFPDFHAQVIDERSGVKTESVVSMLKDHKGFLWILSYGHVQRFDGKQVKLYRPDRLLTSIYCDANGKIWCTSTRKIYRFENEKTGFVAVPQDTVNILPIKTIGRWPDGRTVVLALKGIFQYDSLQHRFVKMDLTGKAGNFNQFMLFQQGLTSNFPQDSLRLFNVSNNIRYTMPLHGITEVITLSEDFVLLSRQGDRTELYRLGDSLTVDLLSIIEQSQVKPPMLHVYNAAKMDKDRYLLPTNFGLYLLDLSVMRLRKIKFFVDGKPLQNEGSVKHVYVDKEGRAFLSHETGILTFHTRRADIGLIRNFTSEPEQGFSNQVNRCLYDNKNNFWIATNKGFTKWDLSTNKLSNYLAGKEQTFTRNLSIYNMEFDGRNLLIGSAGQGLRIFNPETETFSLPGLHSDDPVIRSAVKSGSVRVLQPLGKDSYLVGLDSHLLRLRKDNYRYEVIKPDKRIRTAFISTQTSNGNVWLGTVVGLFCLDSTFKIIHDLREQFSASRHIYSLCSIDNNNMLVGTRGLYKVTLQDGKPDVTVADSFFADKVIQILYRDKNGYVWVGTDDGLFRFDMTTRRIQSFNGETVRIKGYHNPGLYVAPDGTVFMCGNYGINYFVPEKIPLQQMPVDIHITKFIVNDDDSSYLPSRGEHFLLSHNDRSVAIEFAAPYYENPLKPSYRYKLEGADHHWTQADNISQVRYSSLLPGNYTFKVAVSVDGMNWYETKSPLVFTIDIPWWQTGWFRLLSLLVLMALGVLAYSIFQKRKQEKEVRNMLDYFANSGYEHSTVDDILWDIARNCISRLHFEDCVIYLLDDERGMLMQKAAYGPKSPKAFEIMNPIEIPLGKGIVGTVAQTGKAEIVKDTTTDPRYIVDDKARMSEITVPIIHEGNVIGIIDSEHRRKYFFKERHVHVLQTIANLCSAKISRGMALDAMRKSKLQLMELNMKMAESKFLNLRLQMNPHFLFNSLSSIQHLVVSQQTSRAYKYLTVFSNLLRSLLQYAEANFISLDKEMAMLRMYLDLETLRFDESFNYSIDVDESLEQEEVLLPSLMVQPFAENAIWHGLMHKQGDKKLHIRFTNHHDDYLTCIIEDNGIGRSAAGDIRKKNITSMVHESKGIRIIEERLSLLQRKTGKPARVEIFDKSDDAGGSAGTRVVIIIPFYNKEEV